MLWSFNENTLSSAVPGKSQRSVFDKTSIAVMCEVDEDSGRRRLVKAFEQPVQVHSGPVAETIG